MREADAAHLEATVASAHEQAKAVVKKLPEVEVRVALQLRPSATACSWT